MVELHAMGDQSSGGVENPRGAQHYGNGQPKSNVLKNFSSVELPKGRNNVT